MAKFVNVIVACAVLSHSLAQDCNAIGVVTPTTAGGITSGQDIQSSGVSFNATAVKIEWKDGSGLVKRNPVVTPGAAMPFEWHADFNLASPAPAITAWVKGTSECRMWYRDTPTTWATSIWHSITTPTIT